MKTRNALFTTLIWIALTNFAINISISSAITLLLSCIILSLEVRRRSGPFTTVSSVALLRKCFPGAEINDNTP